MIKSNKFYDKSFNFYLVRQILELIKIVTSFTKVSFKLKITYNENCDRESFMFKKLTLIHSEYVRVLLCLLGLVCQISITYQPFFAVFFSLIKSFYQKIITFPQRCSKIIVNYDYLITFL